jgi:hypothetical protein
MHDGVQIKEGAAICATDSPKGSGGYLAVTRTRLRWSYVAYISGIFLTALIPSELFGSSCQGLLRLVVLDVVERFVDFTREPQVV